MESNEVIAPFVMKTYQMVNDSSLDNLIRWGKSNNTFIVVDSSHLSQRLLPVYFKHNNFSSFIRQLNTYGFRKVDPDRWEFANEWFLRGQVHLLKNIGRKRQTCDRKYLSNLKRFDQEEDEDEKEMIIEIARLKQEQKVLEQEVVTMNKRIEVTERRPEQMMSLLFKVAEDPDILHRMMLEKVQRSKRLVDKKRQRPLITAQQSLPPSSSSNGYSDSIKCELDEYCENIEGVDLSPQTAVAPVPVWFWNEGGGDDGGSFSLEKEMNDRISRNGNNSGGGDAVYFGGGAWDPDGRLPAPPYPFSLFG